MEKSCFIVAEAEENAFPTQKSLARSFDFGLYLLM